MPLHDQQRLINLWRGRLSRQADRLTQMKEDASRSISWHFRGGRRSAEERFERAVREHEWCFIVACNNSGTSLLQRVLENTGVVSTFSLEGQRYTRTLVRGARRGHERVWTEFLDELRLTEGDSAECRYRLVHDWMRELANPVGPLIIEKTTMNAVRMRWLQSVFPRSRFVGLVRNGFAVTEGIMRKGNKSAARGARHWNLVNKIMLDDAKHIENFMLLRYEDLAMQRDQCVRELSRFLDIPYDNLGGAMKRRYEFSTVNGVNSQEITDLNEIGISRLTQNDVDTVRREASEMLAKLEYDIGNHALVAG